MADETTLTDDEITTRQNGASALADTGDTGDAPAEDTGDTGDTGDAPAEDTGDVSDTGDTGDTGDDSGEAA